MILTACGCPTNYCGDIPCRNCGEMVNKRCWACGTERGAGPCPNPVDQEREEKL